MVDSLKKPVFEEVRPGVKVPAKETILTPRFYTTDFEKMSEMDISVNEKELQAILEEFRADYNRHHFVRDEGFDQSWDHIDGETRQLFVEFWSAPAPLNFLDSCFTKNSAVGSKTKAPCWRNAFN